MDRVMINMAYGGYSFITYPWGIRWSDENLSQHRAPDSPAYAGGAIMLEIPIAMIFLSRVLKYKVNRWATSSQV